MRSPEVGKVGKSERYYSSSDLPTFGLSDFLKKPYLCTSFNTVCSGINDLWQNTTHYYTIVIQQ
jgi:hypothetical protein